MKANQGSGNWVQYLGAAALLAFIGYGAFKAYNFPGNVLKLPSGNEIVDQQSNTDAASEQVTAELQEAAAVENSSQQPENLNDNEVSELTGADDVPDIAVSGSLDSAADNTETAAVENTETDAVDNTETDAAENIDSDNSENADSNNSTTQAVLDNQNTPVDTLAPDAQDTELAVLDTQEQSIENVDTEPPTETVEETEANSLAEPKPVTDVALETDIDLAPEADAISTEAPSEPQFDLVRLDAAGSGLVAGRADPGTTVRVLSNGIDVGTADVSSSGEFVAFIQIPGSDEGQSLTLEALGLDETGAGTSSVDRVLVLPSEDENQEAQAPTIVQASNEDVRVIQPGGIGQLEGVSLDSISYDESGDVVLAGRGRAGDGLRIYVDNDATAEAIVSSGGTWEARFSSVDEGRYTLRVDAQDASGKVSSRVESPFQRVFPTAEQLTAPSKITVQPGNSLWLMATERYGSGHLYTQIYAANQDAIRDPDLIYPGQIFELPSVEASD